MTALLEIRELSKRYGNAEALRDVSFSVRKGEFVSVIGPSGAGKSTLLRCINRMVEASGGEIVFDGVRVLDLGRKELRKLRTQIGMVFQHYNLVNRLTVIENVLHGRLGHKSVLAGALGLFREEEKAQAIRLLEKLGLKDQIHKRSDQLSGGQKQRVGIARALVQNPKLLLCDEPIASLDPNASRIIMDHLKDISVSMGITVLVNLHQVWAALKYADRVIGVSAGRIVYDGPPEDLTAEHIRRIYGADAGELILDAGGQYAAV